jgi:hypothetical protein
MAGTNTIDIQTFQQKRYAEVIHLLEENGYSWLKDYPKKNLENGDPDVYHGTFLSNVTGIRLHGLLPFKEFGDAREGRIFVVQDPLTAAAHILSGGQYDTFAGNDKEFPKMAIEEKLKNDPMIILKIDFEAVHRDTPLRPFIYNSVHGTIPGQDTSTNLIDYHGLGLPIARIDPKHIKAVIHTEDGDTVELSLDDLIDKVLIKNELGIYPDFMAKYSYSSS